MDSDVETELSVWSWLPGADAIVGVHRQNAIRYDQFIQATVLLNIRLSNVKQSTIENSEKEANCSYNELAASIEADVIELLECHDHFVHLCLDCCNIHPIHNRRQMLVKSCVVKAIGSYEQNEVKISRSNSYLLVDNSDPLKWKVRDSNGTMFEAPSVLFVIPPQDIKVVELINKLRDQAYQTWVVVSQFYASKVRYLLLKTISRQKADNFTDHEARNVKDLIQDSRSLDSLAPSSSDVEEVKHFRQWIQNWIALTEQLQESHTSTGSRTVERYTERVKALRRLFDHIQFIDAFMKTLQTDHMTVEIIRQKAHDKTNRMCFSTCQRLLRSQALLQSFRQRAAAGAPLVELGVTTVTTERDPTDRLESVVRDLTMHDSIDTLSDTFVANCMSGVLQSRSITESEVPISSFSEFADGRVAVLPASNVEDNVLDGKKSQRCDGGDCGIEEPEQKLFSDNLAAVLDLRQEGQHGPFVINSVSTVSEPPSSGVCCLEQTCCPHTTPVVPDHRVSCVVSYASQESVASLGGEERQTAVRNRQKFGFASSTRAAAQLGTTVKLPKAKSEAGGCWGVQHGEYSNVGIGAEDSSPASAVDLSNFAIPRSAMSEVEVSAVVSAASTKSAVAVNRLLRTETVDLSQLKELADGNSKAPRHQSLVGFQRRLDDWLPQLVSLCSISEPATTCVSQDLLRNPSRTLQLLPAAVATKTQTLISEHGTEHGSTVTMQQLDDGLSLLSFSNNVQRSDDVLSSGKKMSSSWQSVDINVRVRRSSIDVQQQSLISAQFNACTKEMKAVTNLDPRHENNIARFAESFEQLQKALAVTEKQLDTFGDGSKAEIAVDEMDSQTLDDIEIQLLNNEPMLAKLRNVAATLTQTPDSQLDNAEVQCMLQRIEERFNANRTVIVDKRRWLDAVLQRKKDSQLTTSALHSWLDDASSQLAEMCKVLSVDRFRCDQQLSTLISLSTQFDEWQDALEGSSYRMVSDVSTIDKDDLVQKFAAARRNCSALLAKQRDLFKFVNDVHQTIEKIASWSVVVGKKFCADKVNVTRLVVADLRRARDELVAKRKTLQLLKSRADGMIEKLRAGVDGERCVIGRKSEKCLMEPLNDQLLLLGSLFESLKEKLHLLAVRQLCKYEDSVDQLVSSVTMRFENVSVSNSKLMLQQLEDIQTKQHEIEGQCNLILNGLSELVNDSSARTIVRRVSHLRSLLSKLKKETCSRFEELMEVVPKIERFYEIVEDLQSEMDKLKMKAVVIKVPLCGSVESILSEIEEVQAVSEAAWEKRLYLRELSEIAKWIGKVLKNKEAMLNFEKVAKIQRSYKQFEEELWTTLTKLKQELLSTQCHLVGHRQPPLAARVAFPPSQLAHVYLSVLTCRLTPFSQSISPVQTHTMTNCCCNLLCSLNYRVQNAEDVGCTVELLDVQELDIKNWISDLKHCKAIIIRIEKSLCALASRGDKDSEIDNLTDRKARTCRESSFCSTMLTPQHYHWYAATLFTFPGGEGVSSESSEHYVSDISLLKGDAHDMKNISRARNPRPIDPKDHYISLYEIRRVLVIACRAVSNSEDLAKWQLTCFNESVRIITDSLQTRGQLLSDARQVVVAFKQTMSTANEIFTNAFEKLTNTDNAEADMSCLMEEHHKKIQMAVESPPVSEADHAPKHLTSQTDQVAFKSVVHNGLNLVEDLVKCKDKLKMLCGATSSFQIEKEVQDIELFSKQVNYEFKHKELELNSTVLLLTEINSIYQLATSWLQTNEDKLRQLSKIPDTQALIYRHISDLRVLSEEMRFQSTQVNKMSCNSYALPKSLASQDIVDDVKELRSRWITLQNNVATRQKLQLLTLLELNEHDKVIEELDEALNVVDVYVSEVQTFSGDLPVINHFLAELQMKAKLVDGYASMIEQFRTNEDPPLSPGRNKTKGLEDKCRHIKNMILSKEKALTSHLNQVTSFGGEVDDVVAVLTEEIHQINALLEPGATLNTARDDYAKFEELQPILKETLKMVEVLLDRKDAIFSDGIEKRCFRLKISLKRMTRSRNHLVAINEMCRLRFVEHMKQISLFDVALAQHDEWISKAELDLGKFVNLKKLLDAAMVQQKDFKNFEATIEDHRKLFHGVVQCSTYLRFFSKRNEAMQTVGKELPESIVRWRRLLLRACKTRHSLEDAYQTSRRFYVRWKSTLLWITNAQESLNESSAMSALSADKVFQIHDKTKECRKDIAWRTSSYLTALHLGKQLKERCETVDPERALLSEMLQGIKSRWKTVWQLIVRRENLVHKTLLSLGLVNESLQTVYECLVISRVHISEGVLLNGDLLTVRSLVIETNTMTQQIADKNVFITELQNSNSLVDPELMNQAVEVQATVSRMCAKRDEMLRHSLILAETYKESLKSLSEWLRSVQTKLDNFSTIPADQSLIASMLSQISPIYDEVCDHKDRMKQLGVVSDEILSSCHPNATQTIEQQTSMIESGWYKLLKQLQYNKHALQCAGQTAEENTKRCVELIAWVKTMKSTLAAKMSVNVTDDMVDVILKDQIEFTTELGKRRHEIESLTNSRSFRTNVTANEASSSENGTGAAVQLNSRVHLLETSWHQLWQTSVNYKKKLQDASSKLQLAEALLPLQCSFRNWQQRFNAWLHSKLMRSTDLFRKHNGEGGMLTRDDFVEAVMAAKFPTTVEELHTVFDQVDVTGSGKINYSQFADALCRKRSVSQHAESSEEIQINKAVDKLLSSCRCVPVLSYSAVGKMFYCFGTKTNKYKLKVVGSGVMVRIGCNYEPLTVFIDKIDPCRTVRSSAVNGVTSPPLDDMQFGSTVSCSSKHGSSKGTNNKEWK